jgi:polysaccharide biosynthesis transport protein
MNNRQIEIDESEITIDLFTIIDNLWRGVKKFGWLVLVFAVISSSIACLQTKRSYYPYYTAATTFAVKLSQNSDGSIYQDSMRASQMSATFPYILSSSVLMKLIAEDLGMEYISESISADNVEDTNLFTLHVSSSDPQRAYDVLQSVINNYPKVAEPVIGSTYLRVIEETGIPTTPMNKLNYKRSVKRGAIPGAVLGLAIIFIYAITRRTIHNMEDLTGLTNVKQLGVLPQVVFKKRGRKHDNVISIHSDKLPYSYREKLYKIRTRVEKIVQTKGLKSILITSAIPGEGKSTFTFNLALALAHEGKKVVLVDCDFRRPMIRKLVNFPEDAFGIYDVLNDEVELKDAISYNADYKLSTLACMHPMEDASEVAGSAKLHDIITELKENYDNVIIDTSPSAILSDTSDLAKHVDGAIFIIKQDYSKVNHILEGLEHLAESSNIQMIGCVLNGTRNGLSSYGFGYGGYVKYGGYGELSKGANEELVVD